MGNSEETMRDPSTWKEPETQYSEIAKILGFYFFQYRDFPAIEYLLEIFLDKGNLPKQDYFREYLPDTPLPDRLKLIRLLENVFRNVMGAYRGSLLHFLDVIAPIMIDEPTLNPKGLLQHVPSYSKHQREILAHWFKAEHISDFEGLHFPDGMIDKLTPYQMAFIGELLSNGKLGEYERDLLVGLPENPSEGLTQVMALQIFHVWLMYMLTTEFPEGILINANNSSKIFYSDKIILDGIQLIHNWFQICQYGKPRVIREKAHKEVDIYLKLKWKFKDMEAQCAASEPLPPAQPPIDALSPNWVDPDSTDAQEDMEVHCMFRCRLDKIVGKHGFDRKTGDIEDDDSIGGELEDLLTLIAIELYNWNGAATKPKGKMVYVEIYANEIPELTSRLFHMGLELDPSGTGFKGIERSIPADQVPERMRLLTLFVRERVAHKESLGQAIKRQKVSVWSSPKSLLDKKPPKAPVKKTRAEKAAEKAEAETNPPLPNYTQETYLY